MDALRKQLDSSYIPWRLLACLLLVSLPIAVFYLTRPVNFVLFNWIINSITILYPSVLALLCWQGSFKLLRPAGPAASTARRFCPLLLGMALWCFVLAEIAWLRGMIALGRSPTFPALEHLVFLGMYPFFLGAFLLLPSRNISLFTRLRIFLDSLLIMTAIATLFYYFILAPVLARSTGTALEKIILSFYPGADLVLMFFLLQMALRVGEAFLRPILIMLGLAITGLFISDASNLHELLSLHYDEFSSADALQLLTGMMIVGAAQAITRMLSKGDVRDAVSPVEVEQSHLLYPASDWRTLLPSALVLVFSLLTFALWLNKGQQTFPGQFAIVYAGGFTVLVLMVLRQFLAIYEIGMLQRKLQIMNCSLRMLNEQLGQQANTDPLTGLPNHRALIEKLDRALTCARETPGSCAVIFMDIDHFKEVNDHYGHRVGDMVLCRFGELVRSSLRATDQIGRWGGEEFLAILPGVTPDEARQIAERIRRTVEQQVLTCEPGMSDTLRLTCSLGVAGYPQDASERDSLFLCADRAMYVAKSLGRNQTRAASEPPVRAMGRPERVYESLH